MTSELIARLAELAAQRQTTGYGALAKDLGFQGAGSIARLTDALEALMQLDAAAEQPLRAALVVGRMNNNLPATGFFLKAQELGLYDGTDPVGFVQAQRARLWSRD